MAEKELGYSQGIALLRPAPCVKELTFLVPLQELRPQDSIPFLRRVSADLQKSEVARYLSQIEMPEPSSPEALARVDDISSSSPTAPRASNASVHPMADNDIAPREHSFVKTTFSKRKQTLSYLSS